MSVVHQHPRELVLSLFLAAPSFPITVLSQKKQVYGRWTVEIDIIGESHAIIFFFDSEPVFSEVLACYPLAKHRCYYAYEFEKMDHHHIHIGPYYGRVNFREAEWKMPPEVKGEVLTYDFPSVNGAVPQTRVQWSFAHQRFQWWTLHTYPMGDEIIRVYSLSQYDFASKQGR
jgi:hypothetical protein